MLSWLSLIKTKWYLWVVKSSNSYRGSMYPDKRESALKGLIKIGASAKPSLIKALEHKNHFVRQVAIEVLVTLQDTTTIEPILSRLLDNNLLVRLAAREALDKLGATEEQLLNFYLRELNDPTRDICWDTDYDIVRALSKVCRDKEQLINIYLRIFKNIKGREVVEFLGNLSDLRAVEPLYNELKSGVMPDLITKTIVKIGGSKADFIKTLFAEIEAKIKKIKLDYSDSRIYELLPHAIKIREQGLDFEIIYHPEEEHMERVLDLIAWSYNPGGAGNIDEWRVDNPERFEIVPLPNDS